MAVLCRLLALPIILHKSTPPSHSRALLVLKNITGQWPNTPSLDTFEAAVFCHSHTDEDTGTKQLHQWFNIIRLDKGRIEHSSTFSNLQRVFQTLPLSSPIARARLTVSLLTVTPEISLA